MKILSLLLFLPALLFAQTPTPWNGTDVDSTWYTSNKNATTYTIRTAKELAGLAALANRDNSPVNFEGKTIILGADIALNDTNANGGWQNWGNNGTGLNQWTPIRFFVGNFYGNGKVISGLYINKTYDNDNQGLFGTTSAKTISNLGLVGFYVKGNEYVGGIFGRGYYTIVIVNSYAIGNVSGEKYVGGIAGSIDDNAIVRNSYFAGTVTGSDYVGGIFGIGGTATNSFYDSNLLPSPSNISGTPKTTTEMKNNVCELLQMSASILKTNDASNNNYMGWQCNSGDYPSFSGTMASSINVASYFASGTGTSTNPYIIMTKEQLENLSLLTNLGYNFKDKYIKLGANIALNDTNANGGWRNWGNGTGLNQWTPIGNNSNVFQGNFDGNGKVISGLYINNTNNNNQGLFGYATSISNLGLEGFYVKGNNSVGSIAGNGSVTNSYAIGNVSGNNYVGGIVGNSGYTINTVVNSYFAGIVTGSGSNVGGISGGTTVTNSFYDSNLLPPTFTSGTPTTTENMKNSICGSLKKQAGILSIDINNNYMDWECRANYYPSFSGTKVIFNAADYLASGAGTSTDPYIIITKEQLEALSLITNSGYDFKDKYIRLGANIALNDTSVNGGWQNWDNNGTGLNQWTPIGNNVNNVKKPFRGNFDGNGKVVSGLYIYDYSYSGYKGFFGYVENASISNLGLVNFYVNCPSSGAHHIGGIAGEVVNSGTITNSYAIGNVKGRDNYVGGISGYGGTITSSYFIGDVSGSGSVGGISGSGGTITNSYAIGNVKSSGGGYVGGISNDYANVTNSYFAGTVTGTVGYVGSIIGGTNGKATNSFYDSNLAGDRGSGGKTSAEMRDKATFQSWDFGIWGIGYPTNSPLNDGMPYLQWQTPVGQALVQISDTAYTGSPIKPTPTVTLNGVKKVAGEDFNYKYEDENINFGKGSVTIVGTTTFWGERKVTFTITKAPSTDCKVTMADFTASGTPSDPVPSSLNGTYSTSSVTYSYKSLNDNSYSGTSRPANAGIYRVTATFPANTNYLACKDSADFTITEGDCAPKKIPVTWTTDSVFTFNKMVQAPVPSVDEPGIELLRGNAFVVAGIYKGIDAVYATIKEDTLKCSYALTNNSKNYEIKKKNLKPYFEAPAALLNIESNTDTLWVPQTIFKDQTLLKQVLNNLVSYDGFAQDTITKEKDDASVLRNTPAINVIYATPQPAQKMLAKRVETTQTAIAVINTDGVSADNYALAKRSITIMEILDDDEGSKRTLCFRGNYCTELDENVCTFINGEKVSNCNNIRRSCQIDSDLCIDNMFISECNSIGGTVITMSCDEYALPIKRPTLASNAFRVWQTASGVVNVDLGYIPTEPITVKIYNLQGKMIATGEANTRFATIKLNSGDGIYIFKAGNRNAIKALK
jgi:hypothetical protein